MSIIQYFIRKYIRKANFNRGWLYYKKYQSVFSKDQINVTEKYHANFGNSSLPNIIQKLN